MTAAWFVLWSEVYAYIYDADREERITKLASNKIFTTFCWPPTIPCTGLYWKSVIACLLWQALKPMSHSAWTSEAKDEAWRWQLQKSMKEWFPSKMFSRIQRGRKTTYTQKILALLLSSPRSYSLPKFTTYTVVKSQFLGLQLSRQILSVKI
jgi:hypothetical protein